MDRNGDYVILADGESDNPMLHSRWQLSRRKIENRISAVGTCISEIRLFACEYSATSKQKPMNRKAQMDVVIALMRILSLASLRIAERNVPYLMERSVAPKFRGEPHFCMAIFSFFFQALCEATVKVSVLRSFLIT